MRFVASILLSLSMVGSCLADIITYDLTSANGGVASVAPTTTASNATGLSLTRGAGLEAAAGVGGSFSAAGWNNLESTDYLSFGFTVDGGYRATLTQLTFGALASNTGPVNMAVRTSADNFATDLAQFVTADFPGSSHNINLSAFDNVQGALEFRIYARNTVAIGGSVSTTGRFMLGSSADRLVTIGGNITAVPEPSSLALLFAAGLGLSRIRKRTRLEGETVLCHSP